MVKPLHLGCSFVMQQNVIDRHVLLSNDKVTGIRFIFLPEATKVTKSKTLDTGWVMKDNDPQEAGKETM